MKNSKPPKEPTSNKLDVEFSQDKFSVIREAFYHMYSQSGKKPNTDKESKK